MRRIAPLLLLVVLAVSGCTGQTSTPPTATSTPSPAPTPTVTPTPTPTRPAVSPTPTPTATEPPTPPPTTAPTDAADPARAQIVEACQAWQTSLSQDASTFPATQRSASSLATSAAAADAQWLPIATSMATLLSLIDDTSADGIATGRQTLTELGTQCAVVGVTVTGG